MRGVIRNISRGSFFVELPVGELPKVKEPLTFKIPEQTHFPKEVTGIAECRWVRASGDYRNARGFGAQFTDLSGAAKIEIDSFVQFLLKLQVDGYNLVDRKPGD